MFGMRNLMERMEEAANKPMPVTFNTARNSYMVHEGGVTSHVHRKKKSHRTVYITSPLAYLPGRIHIGGGNAWCQAPDGSKGAPSPCHDHPQVGDHALEMFDKSSGDVGESYGSHEQSAPITSVAGGAQAAPSAPSGGAAPAGGGAASGGGAAPSA